MGLFIGTAIQIKIKSERQPTLPRPLTKRDYNYNLDITKKKNLWQILVRKKIATENLELKTRDEDNGLIGAN